MSAENSKHDGNLVPSVKMIKCWNRGIDYAFESFYLELLAIETFKSVIISKFPSGMRYFFDKGREAIKYRVKDPVKYGGYINGLRNARTVEQGIRRFEVAYVRARSAEKCERQGYTAYAIDMWRRIFGAYFPSYG